MLIYIQKITNTLIARPLYGSTNEFYKKRHFPYSHLKNHAPDIAAVGIIFFKMTRIGSVIICLLGLGPTYLYIPARSLISPVIICSLGLGPTYLYIPAGSLISPVIICSLGLGPMISNTDKECLPCTRILNNRNPG